MTCLGWRAWFERACVAFLVVGAPAGLAVAGTPAEDAPGSCASEVAALERWAPTLPTMDGVLPSPHSSEIAETRLVDADLAPLARSRSRMVVELRASGILVFGHDDGELEGMAALGPWLKDAGAKLDASDPTRTLILAVEAARPWAEVVAVAKAAAAAGFDQLDFAFQRSTKVVAPPAARVRQWEKLLKDEPDPFMRRRAVAMNFAKTFDGCKPALMALGHMAGVDFDYKIAALTSDMPPALRECRCSVAPRDAMAFMWMLDDPDAAGVMHRSYIGARLRLAKAGKPATVVGGKKSTPWSQALTAVTAASAHGATAPVRLEASGR